MDTRVELAYVGSVVPDTDEFRNEAFNRAGNMFQENLLAGLTACGMRPSMVLSVTPMAAFPHSRRLRAPGGVAELESGLRVALLSFPNVVFLKQLLLGVNVFFHLLWWRWQRRQRPLIVYTFNLSVPPALFTLLGACCIGARAVASVNDVNIPGATVPRTWQWRLDFLLHRFLLPRFDALVAVSDAMVKDFAPRVRHIRVEGGITPEMAAAPARPSKAARSRKLTVVLAGTMNAVNGVAVALEAISRLEGDQYRFIFAGNGPLSEAVRRAAANDRRIEYRGYLKLEDLLPIYRQADLLMNMRLTKSILTPYFFPSKLMELLVSATPVLSTCAGHVEEEFGNFIFLLKDESPEGLAAAIRRVEETDPRIREEMGRRAREYMLARKTWKVQSRRVHRLLKTVAGVAAEGSEACEW